MNTSRIPPDVTAHCHLSRFTLNIFPDSHGGRYPTSVLTLALSLSLSVALAPALSLSLPLALAPPLESWSLNDRPTYRWWLNDRPTYRDILPRRGHPTPQNDMGRGRQNQTRVRRGGVGSGGRSREGGYHAVAKGGAGIRTITIMQRATRRDSNLWPIAQGSDALASDFPAASGTTLKSESVGARGSEMQNERRTGRLSPVRPITGS